MYIRDVGNVTLDEVIVALDRPKVTTATQVPDIEVNLIGAEPTFTFGESDQRVQVPVDEDGVAHLATLLDVPYKFVHRQEPDLQEMIFRELLSRNPGLMLVEYEPDRGIRGFRDVSAQQYRPVDIAHCAARVVGSDAQVIQWHDTKAEFGLDVVTNRIDLGDPKEGDISHGGLRFGMKYPGTRKQANLAPWVQELVYRVKCTNGMTLPDHTAKIEARGLTVDAMLEHLESEAHRLFNRVDAQVEAFYSLRDERVAHPERQLIRLAHEQGISQKMTSDMLLRVPNYVSESDGSATMFDLVNVITNQANAIETPAAQRKLQEAGGSIVSEHVERCSRCKAKLN